MILYTICLAQSKHRDARETLENGVSFSLDKDGLRTISTGQREKCNDSLEPKFLSTGF